MKKILTTTVMTAILATSGFALDGGDAESKDPVGKVLYGTFDFTNGTDSYPSTIMPSGKVTIGDNTNIPVIASEWTLEKGSVMSVAGNGFKLTGQININPNAVPMPAQCNIDKSEDVYYEYIDTNEGIKYYKKVGEGGVATGDYFILNEEDLTLSKVEEPPEDNKLSQTLGPRYTGFPDLRSNQFKSTGLIDVYDEGTGTAKGKICGGTVTYAAANAAILSKDTTNLQTTSLSGITGNKCTLITAEIAGYQEGYLNQYFPTLKCCSNTLNLGDTPAADKLTDSETLKAYLNSFGFYPDPVTVATDTGLELIAKQTANDAILIPADYNFTQPQSAATGQTFTIATNLHNTGKEFTNTLWFIAAAAAGTQAIDPSKLDTLKFSGDNSNLVPEKGVRYEDVNVTFEGEGSWIEPKAEGVIFTSSQTNRSITPTLTIDKSMSIHSNVTMKNGAILAIGDKQTVKFFGNLTFS